MRSITVALWVGALTLMFGSIVRADASHIVGTYWFPDKTGQVEIYLTDANEYFGKVVSYQVPEQRDENNPDPQKRGQQFVGSFIFESFRYNKRKRRWEDGTIYDARDGKTYKCRIWFEAGNLDVLKARGYVGTPLLGRTEDFERVAMHSAHAAAE